MLLLRLLRPGTELVASLLASFLYLLLCFTCFLHDPSLHAGHTCAHSHSQTPTHTLARAPPPQIVPPLPPPLQPDESSGLLTWRPSEFPGELRAAMSTAMRPAAAAAAARDTHMRAVEQGEQGAGCVCAHRHLQRCLKRTKMLCFSGVLVCPCFRLQFFLPVTAQRVLQFWSRVVSVLSVLSLAVQHHPLSCSAPCLCSLCVRNTPSSPPLQVRLCCVCRMVVCLLCW